MKKLTIIVILVISNTLIIAQHGSSCLPEGITFQAQTQIDNFQTNYPNCTEIEGDVVIEQFEITNLNGLSVLTSIGGNLELGRYGSPPLTSLTGFDNLTAIGGDLMIKEMDDLISLTGFDNLISLGGHLKVHSCYSLTSLTALANLVSIGGDLSIWGNISLTSLSGLENITTASIDNLYIIGNDNLSSCDIQNICDYLASPNGSVNIYSNSTGCNNPPEVADICGCALPCLPFGNYYFLSQDDINNFQLNYPGCTELKGNVVIKGSTIINLNGLAVISSIGGNLDISYNDSLLSLNGLDSLTSVSGNIRIAYNNSLLSLTGMDNLTSIGGSLIIEGNDTLTDLTGLENLSVIESDLSIGWIMGKPNYSIASLIGVDNLDTIGGNLEIFRSHGLIDLSGLEDLIFIGGDISIARNDALVSLAGLENISSVPGDLLIGNHIYGYPVGNPSLADLSGLQNITSVGGELLIRANDSLVNLAGLDSLSSVLGDLNIRNNDNLTGLSGLDNLTTIGGSFGIDRNSALQYLNGLTKIDTIGGDLIIHYNYTLESLEGLANVVSVGGDLRIMGNYILTDLSGLDSLVYVGEDIIISNNYDLVSLSGLDHVDAASVRNLRIMDNTDLSTCHVQSICEYLVSPNGDIEIRDNAMGCWSRKQVEDACGIVGVEQLQVTDSELQVMVYPNPFTTSTTIEYELQRPETVTITFYNQFGKQVDAIIERQQPGLQHVEWYPENLVPGLYFMQLQAGNNSESLKIIKTN